MGNIIPDEGWVIQDDEIVETLEKQRSVPRPRTPDIEEEEEKIHNVEVKYWKMFPGTTRWFETHGELEKGTCERLGLGDPWPEFEAKKVKKGK